MAGNLTSFTEDPFQRCHAAPQARRRISGQECQLGTWMSFLIGLVLIMVGAPLVGVIGTWIEDAGYVAEGKTVSVGGYLAVLCVAAWLIISYF